MKPIEYYIHIPFCVRKCRYCDFLSFASEKEIQEKYLKQLYREIQNFDPKQEYEISSIFIGGGTPSILDAKEIVLLMQVIRENHCIAKNAEITIESNPGTLSLEKLECYHQSGINRLSMGVQSFRDQELKLLGRIHNEQDVYENFTLARKAGFQNINLDLMSALPGQTQAEFEENLKKAVALNPEHISAYSLIIEEGTPFYEVYGEDELRKEEGKEPRYLPSEEEERNIYYSTKRILEEHGYQRYEISNYAKVGKECRHNIGYWERAEYKGFGLGAASLIGKERLSNGVHLNRYLDGHYDTTREELTEEEEMEETMFLGLRMMKGVSGTEFYQKYGKDMRMLYQKTIDRLLEEKLLSEKQERIFLTEKGVDLANYVMAQFLN